MISQETVVLPRRRPDEDEEIEWDEDDEPGSAFQADVDALIAKVDEVREALELRQNQRLTPARRIQFMEQHVLSALCDDADVTHMFVPVVLNSSDGDELILMASIQGYSFTIIRTEWWGIVESEEAFRESLLARGWIEGVAWFQKLPAKRKLAIVTGEVRAQPTPDSE